MYCLPALLQTSDYARAIIRGVERKMDPEVLEQRVEVRTRRQQYLAVDACRLQPAAACTRSVHGITRTVGMAAE